MPNNQKIEQIECVNIYAVGKPWMGTETLIVAAGKYVPDNKISVVTDDPIKRKVEVEEFFMRRREITFTNLNTIIVGPSRDRCLWLYSPESACEVSAFNPRITFLTKSGILIYFPAARDLVINTKTITKCLKTMSSN